MNPMSQLTMMLTGNKRGKKSGAKKPPLIDDAEDRMEQKAGRPPTPREEALEDAKGRPMQMRFKKGR